MKKDLTNEDIQDCLMYLDKQSVQHTEQIKAISYTTKFLAGQLTTQKKLCNELVFVVTVEAAILIGLSLFIFGM